MPIFHIGFNLQLAERGWDFTSQTVCTATPVLCNKEAHDESTPALEAPLQGLLGGITGKVRKSSPRSLPALLGQAHLCRDRHISATLKKLPGARLRWDAAPRAHHPLTCSPCQITLGFSAFPACFRYLLLQLRGSR